MGTAHRAVKSRCPLPCSGHRSGLGYVTGGQACQGHLDSGALLGSSLRWRCFAGGQPVAGVPPSSADDHPSSAAAPVLQHGPAAHLVHQTVDLLLLGTQIRQICLTLAEILKDSPSSGSPVWPEGEAHLVVSIHHLEAPAGLVLLHVSQRTLQTEDHVVSLLNHLHRETQSQKPRLT